MSDTPSKTKFLFIFGCIFAWKPSKWTTDSSWRFHWVKQQMKKLFPYVWNTWIFLGYFQHNQFDQTGVPLGSLPKFRHVWTDLRSPIHGVTISSSSLACLPTRIISTRYCWYQKSGNLIGSEFKKRKYPEPF